MASHLPWAGMDAGADGDVAGLSDSFLAHGQYVVEDGQDEDGDQDQSYQESSTPFRDQDRFLPIANVNRIMKKSIPKSGKIAKDAKECVQECVSEFISFITSEASERCHQEKRKTINGEDILFAMSTLGFDNYVEPLKQYLQKYRETLHQTNTKAEKAMETTSLEELTAEDAFTTTLTSNILGECAPQGVIYTTAYQPQMTQQLNLG